MEIIAQFIENLKNLNKNTFVIQSNIDIYKGDKMKKKQFLFIILLLSILLFTVACKKNESQTETPDQTENDQSSSVYVKAQERKIIYTVDATIDASATSLYETLKSIRNSAFVNGWVDSENVTDNFAQLNLRIKTDILEGFIDSLYNYGSVRNLNRSSVDISLDYQNNSNKIDALKAEKARLVELYVDASLSDVVVINSRISEIDMQLVNLEGTQNEYDSLINYSEVKLTIFGYKQENKRAFKTKIQDSFTWGLNAFVRFFEFVLIVFLAILPFVVVFVPIGFGANKIYKHYKKKSNNNNKIE